MRQSVGRYDLTSSGEVGEFIERLALLTSSAWVAAVSAPDDHASEVSAQDMESLITRTGRQIDVWSATDGVDTAAHMAFGAIAGNKRFLANRASAIRGAKGAALALLFRSELSPAEFERLYRPFRDLIPLVDLAEAASAMPRSH